MKFFYFTLLLTVVIFTGIIVVFMDVKQEIEQVMVEEQKCFDEIKRLDLLQEQVDRVEEILLSYEDGMRALELVLENNKGYYLYQELGVVVMCHEEYLRRGR